jgi:hypothetical protein
MAALLPLLLPLLVPSANAQAYDAAERSEAAFSYVQPLNTTILGAYGHSPPFMPSRKSSYFETSISTVSLTQLQPMLPVLAAGRMQLHAPRHSLLN